MYKKKPKSCSCASCKRGKSSKVGGSMLKFDERAYRHNAKIAINKGESENIDIAPIGNYYD